MRFDARTRGLEVAGHVQVDEPPFFFVSDALELRRVPIGVELRGRGKVGFCPCLGTPVAVAFSGATVAPPHDVILRDPVLEVFGLPVAWLPLVWLRSAGRAGLLPPDVAWRGADGFFAGGGAHFPWTAGDVVRGIDVRAGGYAEGGVAADVALRTGESATRVRWDRLRAADGVSLRATGSTASEPAAWSGGAAWDVDALRGARAVVGTTELELAARVVDRARAEASWRPAGWTLAAGYRAVALRGGALGDLGVGGPFVAARRSGAIAGAGAYDATLTAGETGGGGLGATGYARADGGALVAGHLGPVGATLGGRGLMDVARSANVASAWDGAVQVRASLGLPLEGDYASGDAGDPWVHRTEPRVEVAALASRTASAGLLPAGPGVASPGGEAWIASAAWGNALGRWGSRGALDVDVAAGAVGTTAGAQPVVRARAAIAGPWVALRADVARVLSPGAARGGALVAAARVGPAEGPSLSAHLAERDAMDPARARLLVDPALDASGGFLDAAGWTGGAHVRLPIGSRVTLAGGGEVDLDARDLLAVGASIDVHDPCGCVTLRLSGAHRTGRDGADLWVAILFR